MAIILMLNLKGGVAKTTNCVAIAEALAEAGKRVCVVDADHQCMSSELLLGESRMLQAEKRKETLHDLLAAMLRSDFSADEIPPYIETSGVSNIGDGYDNLHMIPCSVRIDDFQTNMAKARYGFQTADSFQRMWKHSQTKLKRHFTDNYDYVLVDCPPTIALQVKQFLRFADGFIVPSVPDALSVRGSLWLLDRIQTMGYKRVQPLGTLWSLYRSQVARHRAIIQETAKGKAPLDKLPRPFKTVIPNASAIAEATAPDGAYPSFSKKYGTQFAKLYSQLAREVAVRVNNLS